MIIDKQQLISLLEDKTDFEREKVEDQLAELIKRIQEAAKQDKTFEIEGFGVFSMEEGNLRFKPSNTLETEINNKYAGMKPIELIGAFKEPEGDEVPAIDENMEGINDKIWAFDKQAEAESEELREPVVESAPDSDKTEEGKKAKELAEQLNEEQEPDASDAESEKIVKKMLGSMEDEPVGPEMPSDEEGMEPEEGDLEEAEASPEKESDMAGKLLVAAVIIIAIGLSGWMAYDTGLVGGSDQADNYSQAGPTAVQQNENEPQTSGEQDDPQNSVASISSEPEQEISVGTQEDPPPEETNNKTGFGLKGKIDETISSGYTIVVHSLRRMDEAENRKESLQEAGYRALVSKADVQGTTYFRVGLGKFETVEDAQQAVKDIPESFQNNQAHFIKRIQ